MSEYKRKDVTVVIPNGFVYLILYGTRNTYQKKDIFKTISQQYESLKKLTLVCRYTKFKIYKFIH